MKWIWLLLFLSSVDAIINPHGPTVVNDYTNCVSTIIAEEFNHSGLLFFVNTMNMSTSVARIREDLLKVIHTELKYNVQIASPTKSDKPICGATVYQNDGKLGTSERLQALPLADYMIAIVDTYEEFSYVVNRLVRSFTWNPKALFIILFFHFATSDKINIAHAENMLECLFKWNVINVAVIVPQADNIRNAIIYGWKPYDPPTYCGYKNETAKNRLFVENTCEHGILKMPKALFYNRVPNNMMGCVLNIIALQRKPFVSDNPKDAANVERNLIDQMVGNFNMTTNYILTEKMRGEKEEDRWNGALGDLIARKGHVILGGIFPDDNIHKDFECSLTYLSDSYTWVIPRAFQLPPSISLIIIFHELVWICSIIVFLLSAVTWRAIGKISRDSIYHRNFGHCFMNALVSILGFAAYSRPKRESLRVFFVFYSIFCILFITSYTTKLIDVLTNPLFEYQIQTVEELVESELGFGGFAELEHLFQSSGDPLDYFILKKWYDIENNHQAMKDVVVYRNFSLLCSRLELAHISATIPEVSDSSGNYKYYALESNVFTVPSEMVALRGFNFMELFSYKLELYKQSGLTNLARTRFADRTMRQRAKLLRSLHLNHGNNNESPLSLEHLQGGFYFLILGYVSGTLALFVEILVSSKFCNDKFEYFRKIIRSNKSFKSVFRTKTL